MNFTEYIRQLPHGSMGRPKSLWTRVHLDPYLFAALLAVALGGMVVLYSATSGDMGAVYRQAIRFGIGFLAMIVVAQFDPRWFQQWGGAVYLVGVLLLVAVLVNGAQAMGAQRWLQIPGLIRFQPSEVMKLAVPVMLSWYISRFGLPPRYRDLLVSAALLLVPVALIIQQPDLGTSLLIASAGLFVIFLAGLSWKLIVSFSIMAIGMIPVLWIWVMRDYQRQRVLTLFDPNVDPLGAGWNIIQSITAIGSGGLT
ncbi:MAG TPA: FtsW/RodA/SpoVE family cell cycle protein, partial [Saccharospirillum sp.]|nr:FtsW/RodA/SpoVE family cell cycle protein [Saccharospirillum sp.]